MTRESIIKICHYAIVTLALSTLVLPSFVMAQQYYDPGLLQRTIDRKPVDFTPTGIRMGSFWLNAGAELAWEYNDNIFYRNILELDDHLIHVRPWLNLNSEWGRHMLNFSAYADLGYYSDFDTQNYQDWVVNLDGRIDVRHRSAFNYKASYMNLHEDRNSTNRRGNIEPTTYTYSGFDVDYTHTFNRLTGTLGYALQDAVYDDGVGFDGEPIDNSDRDRSQETWRLGLGYDYSDKTIIFVEYADISIDYDQVFDNNDYARSSDGYDVSGGVSWDISGVITGDLFLHYLSRDYDDPTLNSISGTGIGANLLWTPTKLTNVNIRFDNSVQQTTQRETSGYLSSLYSVRVQHELRRNILLNARASYTDNNYEYSGENTSRLSDTNVIRAEIGLTYLINRHWYLTGGYTYEQQKANTDQFNYTTNRVFITLGGEL